MQLTRDADKMACLLYKKYLDRRKNGELKSSAKRFHSNFYSEITALSSWNPDDIDETIDELKRSGFVKKYVDGGFMLLDDFIIYMENRFKNGLKEVTDFIAKFIP